MRDNKRIIYWIAIFGITIAFNALRLLFAPESSLGGYVFGVFSMCACNVATALMYD